MDVGFSRVTLGLPGCNAVQTCGRDVLEIMRRVGLYLLGRWLCLRQRLKHDLDNALWTKFKRGCPVSPEPT